MGNETIKEPGPQRNHLCRHYDDCLEAAAMKNLAELPCRGCEHENDQAGAKKFLNYIDGSWALLRALFYPRNKKPQENRAHRLFLLDWPPPVDDEHETHDSVERLHKSSEE